MHRISVEAGPGRSGRISEKAAAVMRVFGLTADRLRTDGFNLRCKAEIRAGDVVLLTGPSGAGKSTLLGRIERSVPKCDRINLDNIELPADCAVVDCVPGDWLSGLRLLSKAGLSDVFCLLNEPGKLSTGQQWRLRLAIAMSRDVRWIFADEYCCGLDRISAMAISHNVSKFARRTRRTFVLATSNRDIVCRLRPDVTIECDLHGDTTVNYRDPVRWNADRRS